LPPQARLRIGVENDHHDAINSKPAMWLVKLEGDGMESTEKMLQTFFDLLNC
jgi:hypothetical protein